MPRVVYFAIVTSLAVLVLAPADEPKRGPGLVVDTAKKTVTIDARVAPRKLNHLPQVYPIEVIATFPFKEGVKGKAHETVLTTLVKPSDVHRALETLGLKPGKPARGEGAKAEGPEVRVFIEAPQPDGSLRRLAIDRVLIDPKTRKPMPKGVKFFFTGSAQAQPDPNNPVKVYGADITGTLIALFPVTDETVLQTSLTMAEEKYLKLDVNPDALPKVGEPVKLVLEAREK
jgi:hypothetical protein